MFRKKDPYWSSYQLFQLCPLSYKLGLVKTVVDEVYEINNTWLGFHGDIKRLTMIFRKNCFLIWVIDKIIHSQINVNPANARTCPLSSEYRCSIINLEIPPTGACELPNSGMEKLISELSAIWK